MYFSQLSYLSDFNMIICHRQIKSHQMIPVHGFLFGLSSHPLGIGVSLELVKHHKYYKYVKSNQFQNILPMRMHRHIAIVWFLYPMCIFKWVLNLSPREDAKSHWLHLFGFSPLCVFKCLLKLPACEDAKSHWLHLFHISLSTAAVRNGLGRVEKYM